MNGAETQPVAGIVVRGLFIRDDVGIWACASLLHLLRAEMALAVADCSRILRPGGVFLISVKRGAGEECQDGRRFTFWEMDDLKRLVLAEGFEVLVADEVPSLDGRNATWLCLLMRKP